MLTLSSELREHSTDIRLHLRLRLHRLRLGKASPLLELLHNTHELLEIDTSLHSWSLCDRHLWDLRNRRLSLLLAEQVDGPLEVRYRRLLDSWLGLQRGCRLLLRSPGLDEFE